MTRRKTPLTTTQILAWADHHYEQTGKYPHADSGPVLAEPAENWCAVNQALAAGVRGLPGKETLARLLLRERGRRHHQQLPRLCEESILAWARAHHERTGEWPHQQSGAVGDAPGEVWANINQALRRGCRGLPGGDTLPRLLQRRLGVGPAKRRPGRPGTLKSALRVEGVLAWADAFHAVRGKWPVAGSPAVGLPPGEQWRAIDEALRTGGRGLPGGSSLVRLLVERRGARKRQTRPAG
jgi:hypothetical protein